MCMIRRFEYRIYPSPMRFRRTVCGRHYKKHSHQKKVNQIESMTKKIELPDDLISSILCRLPVKSLLQFKAVSKSWCSMIEKDQYFIQLHAYHSAQIINRCTFLLEIRKYDSKLRLFTSNILSAPITYYATQKFEPLYSNEGIIGSCNGLLCLAGDGALSLLNMATKEYHRIEYQPPPKPQQDHYNFGFGYDSVNDDYKVICVECLSGHNLEDGCCFDQIRTYSLKYDAWSVTQESLPAFKFIVQSQPMILVWDSLHCLVVGRDHKYSSCSVEYSLILAYNLTTEDYQEILLPDCFTQQNCLVQNVSLTKLQESLCIISDRELDVWMMKNYMVKESWTKLFRIDWSTTLLTEPETTRIILLGRSVGDKVLFTSRGVAYFNVFIGWRDLKKEQTEEVYTNLRLKYLRAYMKYADVCFESLVSIKSYRGMKAKPLSSESIT